MKGSFYEELNVYSVNSLNKMQTYCRGDFNVNVGMEDNFKPRIQNDSSQ
jgi:hypothetical protein